jgi:nitrogen regulatory protein P-II 1
MKYIVAVVQPSRLEAVKESLSKAEVFRLTVSDAQGLGRQKGHTEVYRGQEYEVNLVRKVKLEIAVNDEHVQPTIDAIVRGGRSAPEPKIGDGKIFVLPLEEVVRIRTGETGSEAI